MSGKNKCKILKQIRQRIAEENDIAYITAECKYQGECAGSCAAVEIKEQVEEILEEQLTGVAAPGCWRTWKS